MGSEESQNTAKGRRFEDTFVAAPKGDIENQGKNQKSKNRTRDKRMLCLQVL